MQLSGGDAQAFIVRIAGVRPRFQAQTSWLASMQTSTFCQPGTGWPRTRDPQEVPALFIQDL